MSAPNAAQKNILLCPHRNTLVSRTQKTGHLETTCIDCGARFAMVNTNPRGKVHLFSQHLRKSV